MLTAIFLQPLKPAFASSDCHQGDNDDAVYHQFVAYRLAINSATTLADLSHFFVPAFNDYFQQQLDRASNDSEKSQALRQYWNNLNRAEDIVSVYQARLTCRRADAVLDLVVSLKSDLPKIGATISLWQVQLAYLRVNDQWLIEHIEFNKLKKNPGAMRLLNNFSVIP